METAIN